MSGCCNGEDACGAGPRGSDHAYRRVLIVALAVNATMFLIEVVASLFAGSVSLQADALDFLGDAANLAVGLAVLGLSVAWRARAAMGKGAVMGGFGLWVAAATTWHAITGAAPRADIMGGVGLLALAANLSVAALLFRHRGGDSNRRSVWLCSRNDCIANVAVILAGAGVWATGTHWPDVGVAAVIAALGLSGAWQVIRHARDEIRGAGRPRLAAAE
jgi:Co/Zn/Cd efflux system component